MQTGAVQRFDRWTGTHWVLAWLAFIGSCTHDTKPMKVDSSPSPNNTGAATKPPRREFVVLSFGETLGTVAPCGCTTEPLGGLQYAFGYVNAVGAKTSRLVLEPGSFLFPKPSGPLGPVDPAGWTQAHQRASLLHRRFSSETMLISGLGPTDVASPEGVAALTKYELPRVSANVSLPAEGPKVPATRVMTLESHGMTWKVGVTSVVDPKLNGAESLHPTDPVSALRPVVQELADDAEFTVVLAQGDRSFADRLATELKGIDMIVVGTPVSLEAELEGASPRKLGDTFIVEPGNQLQTLTELRLSLDPSLKAVPDPATWIQTPAPEQLQSELERVQARLATFEADPSADPQFLTRLREQVQALQDQLKGELDGDAVVSLKQVKVTCKLPIDGEARSALRAYDDEVARDNRERFTGVKAPPVPKRGSGYEGVDACGDCHEEAVTFWKQTRHAGAYETLVKDNKQFDLDCVGCHVTGFRKPGGSEVVENEGLIDVQCESCHGPGSRHIADGGDDLSLINLEVPSSLCVGECHTPEHSDTFEYDAYLRDILGPGHGDAKRDALGDGPTGYALRQAAFAKAGGACKKNAM